jgi:hypothetical protein
MRGTRAISRASAAITRLELIAVASTAIPQWQRCPLGDPARVCPLHGVELRPDVVPVIDGLSSPAEGPPGATSNQVSMERAHG